MNYSQRRRLTTGCQLSTLLLILIFAGLSLPCHAKTFHSERFGYSMKLPDQWVQMPGDLLDRTKQLLNPDGGSPPFVYEAVFQKAEKDHWLEYPYMMVQVIPYSNLGIDRQIGIEEMKQLVQSMSDINLTKNINKNINPNYQDKAEDAQMGKMFFDSSLKRYQGSGLMQKNDGYDVRISMFGYFGRNYLVQVCFYAIDEHQSEIEQIKLATMSSFKFAYNQAYDPSAVVLHSSATDRTQSQYLTKIITSVILGLFGLACVYLNPMRKKNKNTGTSDFD